MMGPMKPRTATRIAIEDLGRCQTAALCGVTRQAVGKWIKTGRIPARHVLTVERATGVSRYVLRPDIYGSADDEPERALALA